MWFGKRPDRKDRLEGLQYLNVYARSRTTPSAAIAARLGVGDAGLWIAVSYHP